MLQPSMFKMNVKSCIGIHTKKLLTDLPARYFLARPTCTPKSIGFERISKWSYPLWNASSFRDWLAKPATFSCTRRGVCISKCLNAQINMSMAFWDSSPSLRPNVEYATHILPLQSANGLRMQHLHFVICVRSWRFSLVVLIQTKQSNTGLALCTRFLFLRRPKIFEYIYIIKTQTKQK